MSAQVVWFEVLGQDADKLRRFYGELFGWSFDCDNPMGYGMIKNNGEPVAGGVGSAPQGPGWTTFYVQVDDLDGALNRARSQGGTVLMPPTQIPEGTIAVVADPEGHPIGLSSQ